MAKAASLIPKSKKKRKKRPSPAAAPVKRKRKVKVKTKAKKAPAKRKVTKRKAKGKAVAQPVRKRTKKAATKKVTKAPPKATKRKKGETLTSMCGDRVMYVTRDHQARPWPPDGSCRCGCGSDSGTRFFVHGHNKTYEMWLRQEAAGEKSKMPAKIRRKVGPWKPVRGGGTRPTLNYDGRKLPIRKK